jgi:hypothetical protein
MPSFSPAFVNLWAHEFQQEQFKNLLQEQITYFC